MPKAEVNSVLVNKELHRLGFGTLKDPNLFEQMAVCIRDHTHFRRLLMAVEPGQRHIAYEALHAKLRFKAKPLEDYVIESRTLAEQNQLPHYDPKTLAVTEWKPQEFHTRRTDVICELCEANEAVTGDGKWHRYGTPEQCVCAENWLYPDGYSVAPSHSRKLAAVAEEAINRDLREGQAKTQNTLICHKCTKQQTFRMKSRRSLFKIAAEAGWFIDHLKAYCPECKPTLN